MGSTIDWFWIVEKETGKAQVNRASDVYEVREYDLRRDAVIIRFYDGRTVITETFDLPGFVECVLGIGRSADLPGFSG